MSINLYPYKDGSKSAKALAEALGIKRIKLQGSKYKGSKDKLIINWGSSNMSEEALKSTVLNPPEAVALASDKLKFFEAITLDNEDNEEGRYTKIPQWTNSLQIAQTYIRRGHKVVCRTVLNGHSGQGIVIAETEDQLVPAPLYVKYEPKKQEYRFHVFMGEVVDIQRKARDRDVPDDKVNWLVRNHDNGFIYARNGDMGDIPEHLNVHAINAVKICGLHFGAVDIIYNQHDDIGYVLEVNTAPGLSGETLAGYQKRLTELKEQREKNKLSWAEMLDVAGGQMAEWQRNINAGRPMAGRRR